MKIGITGAYGFVGRHLLDALISMPEVEVEPFDKKKYSLFQMESMKPFVEDKEVIFHLAGVNRDTKEALIKTNVLGTLNVLEAITAYAKRDVQLVYLSSFQVYKPPDKPETVNELYPAQPENIYGISKKTAEEIISCYPIKSVIFRGSNFFGPGCKPHYNSVISTFCDLLSHNKPFTVYGSGEQGRDFLYISDVIQVFLQVMNHQQEGVEIVNLCCGKVVTVNQIIGMLSEISGKKIEVNYKDNSRDDEMTWWGDNTKCREQFNWSPQMAIKDGLKMTYEWFRRK